MELSADEQIRYARHLALPQVGVEGQIRLSQAKVLVVGAGGLGSPVAFYLVAGGVGTVGIIDGDVVDMSNLQRQILHSTADIGRPKVESASEKLVALNPNVHVVTYRQPLTEENAREIFSEYDFVVDATDRLDVKFLINDICVELRKPFSYGGIQAFGGQTMTYTPGHASCRDLFSGMDVASVERKAPRGPFGAIAGMLGTIQAAEAMKCILGIGQLLTDRLLRFDALAMRFVEIKIRP
ncbi:MAG: HesA/MoeB/ThiF family protein [Muribaculum sp.]|nr:HesA/MoeB/ThiF family protein [Muribaculum sp.]